MTDIEPATPAARHASNGHSGNGRAHLAAVAALLSTDPTAVPANTLAGAVLPGPAVADATLVREIRRAVAERLAARLQGEQVRDGDARRELARALLSDELAGRSRARVNAGEDPWPVESEIAIARAVMAALFGLGRLQPLVDDPTAVSYTHLTLPTNREV